MLILTRYIGEKIIISANEEIEVILVGLDKSQARIGIIAPENILIHRKEIYDRIQKEKQNNKKVA